MPDPQQQLDVLTDRAGALYSLPAVAMQVLELTAHPKVDNAALKACIENDPALTSKLLKVVNSSLFGLSREVTDLNQALALLGTKPLKLLVLGFSLPERLFANVAGEVLEHYWRHTLTKAVAAREISERFFNQPGDEAFIAGLLSDLGELVLLQDLGSPYANFLRKILDTSADLLEREQEALGFDHTLLSARLLKRWGLPESLVAAIGASKQLQALQHDRNSGSLPRVLHLAELLAQVVADHRIGALPELLEAARAYAGVRRRQIKELVETLEAKVTALAEVLSLQLPAGLDYCGVLEQAHARLSEVAADVAGQMIRQEQDELDQCTDLLDQTRELQAAAARVVHAPHPAIEPVAAPSVVVAASNLDSQGPSLVNGPAAAPHGMKPNPATGDIDRALAAHLLRAVAECRQQRCDLSLLLVAVDDWRQFAVAGSDRVRRFARLFQTACEQLEHPGLRLLMLDDSHYAIVLPACDRRLAVEFASQLRRTLPQPAAASPVTLSLGVATVALPPPNFAASDLYTAAHRCLHAAQSTGGNSVKSIEIY